MFMEHKKSKKFSQYIKESDIESVTRENYGQELILDIHDVSSDFFNRITIRHFAERLCDEIDMKRGPIYLWGLNSQEHKAKTGEAAIKADGISCCQFLYKSSITIHALDEIHKVFINIFSCEKFDVNKTLEFVRENIEGKVISVKNITRK
jgi:S-adenosylmethionine/arginine decarboxylase-like enzyme